MPVSQYGFDGVSLYLLADNLKILSVFETESYQKETGLYQKGTKTNYDRSFAQSYCHGSCISVLRISVSSGNSGCAGSPAGTTSSFGKPDQPTGREGGRAVFYQ